MSASTLEMAPRLDIAREAPTQWRAMLALSAATRGRDPLLGELVRVRVSQLNGCAYCLDMHTIDARANGEGEQRLYLLNAWRETPFYTVRERAALALAEAMTLLGEGHVPDAVYTEAAEQFPPAELAELIWQIVTINAWNRVMIATRALPGNYQPAAGH